MVPIYEEHSVRISHKYTLDEWDALSAMERAFHVAVYRTDRSIKAHQASAEAVKMEKDAKRASKGNKK